VEDNDALVARITSNITHTNFDVTIVDWEKTGLILPSVVRIHKLGTIEESAIEKKIGALQKKDLTKVRTSVKKLFQGV